MPMETMKTAKRQKLASAVSLLFIMSLMTFSISYLFVYALKFDYDIIRLIVTTLAVLISLSVVFLNKITRRIAFTVFAFSLIGGGGYLYKKEMIKPLYFLISEKIISFGEWSLQCIQGLPVNGSSYIHYFVTLLCLLTAMIVYLFTVKYFNFFVLFTMGTAGFVFEVTQKRPISIVALYLFIFASLIYFFRSRYLVIKKDLDDNNYFIDKVFMQMGLLIGIGILGLSGILSSLYPYKAKWLHDIAEALKRKPYYYVTDNFSVQSAGLQTEDNILGGNIDPLNVTVLWVKTPSPIYLKAVAKKTYTGNAWEGENEVRPIDLKEEKLLDTAETLEVVKWLADDEKALETLFYKNNAVIRFANMRTKSLFIPSRTINFDIKSNKRGVFANNEDTLSLEKQANKNFTYAVEFYEPAYSSDKFKDIIKRSEIGFYKEIEEKHPEGRENIAKWAEHAEHVTSEYTQLPEGLPKRIADLAKEVTKEETNNYDRVKALEKYLIANYRYTLKPGLPDTSLDFVDQFLFENKKGYCSYFASAMAVLTRSIGIPSRYVEGYILPENKAYNEEWYNVTNKRAHAWVEVYFEGMGWMIFEATPPYQRVETVAPQGLSMEEAMRNSQASFTGTFENVNTVKTKTSDKRWYKLITAIAVIAAIVIWFRFRKHKLVKMNAKDAALYLYCCYMQLLRLRGLVFEGGETEKMFALRVDDKILLEEPSFTDITYIFQKARYSTLDISEGEKNQMIAYRDTLLKASKRTIGLINYFVFRIKYIFV